MARSKTTPRLHDKKHAVIAQPVPTPTTPQTHRVSDTPVTPTAPFKPPRRSFKISVRRAMLFDDTRIESGQFLEPPKHVVENTLAIQQSLYSDDEDSNKNPIIPRIGPCHY